MTPTARLIVLEKTSATLPVLIILLAFILGVGRSLATAYNALSFSEIPH